MELSLPAWLGGLLGTIIAVAVYVPGIRIIEARLRVQNGPQTVEQRAAFEAKLSVMRRLVLAIDVAVLATAGYWIGNAIWPQRF